MQSKQIGSSRRSGNWSRVIANNSYARGISLTLANDCVGTGPRLQMLTGDAFANRFVEQEFFAWADAICLADKLRTMRLARVSDGESFGLLTSNPRIDSPVQLDFKLVEAEQVTSPILALDSYNGRSLITSPSWVELNQRQSSLGLNFLGSGGIFSAFPFGRTTRYNSIGCRVGFLGDVYGHG